MNRRIELTTDGGQTSGTAFEQDERDNTLYIITVDSEGTHPCTLSGWEADQLVRFLRPPKPKKKRGA